jgi:peptidoglycan/xylan/chitin deacetylase (PgdA/CDA1 family)
MPTLDPQSLCVSPSHFDEHLSVIREQYRPISLSNLARSAAEGRVPMRAVAITFDDGYADNLLFAKPRLAAADVPATVFVTTGYVGGEREFWWDELERLLLIPGSTPPVLQVSADGQTRSWPTGTASERRAAYDDLQPWLRPMNAVQIDDAIVQIRWWARDGGDARASHRALTIKEVDELGRDGLVEIGAHTRRHVSLASQPLSVQREEIIGSKQDLERWLDKPVKSFSYPYGCPGIDYNRGTLFLVREAGFYQTTANYARCVTRLSHVHELPRFLVRDWDGEAFSRRLERFFAL